MYETLELINRIEHNNLTSEDRFFLRLIVEELSRVKLGI